MICNANASWNYRIAAHRIGLEWIASNVDLGIPKKKYYKTLNNAQSHKLLTTAARVGQVVVRGWGGEGGVAGEAVRVGYGSVNLLKLTLALKGWSKTLWGYTSGQSSNNRLIESNRLIDTLLCTPHASTTYASCIFSFSFAFGFVFSFSFSLSSWGSTKKTRFYSEQYDMQIKGLCQLHVLSI